MRFNSSVLATTLLSILVISNFAFSQGIPTRFAGTGHWYQVLTSSSNLAWSQARDSALFRGGYLVSIRSHEENDFVRSLISSQVTPPHNDAAWIGGTDELSEGTWSWTSGEPWQYENWNTGEPNNGAGVNEEDHLLMYGPGFQFPGDSGRWNDYPDHGHGGIASYIIEYDIFAYPPTRMPENGHWYQVFLPPLMTWSQAEAFAGALGGHLATFQSESENAFVAALLADSIDGAFLGACEVSGEGDWRWVTGEMWGYTNWDIGEPNNNNGNEDAVGMWGPAAIGGVPGTWNDFNRSQYYGNPFEFGFVVEYDCDMQSVAQCPFERQDANCDGAVDILDVVKSVARAFRGEPAEPPCCDLISSP